MAQSEARAWWADVQHLKDAAERTDEARRRADQADLAARHAKRERRPVERELSPPRRRADDAPHVRASAMATRNPAVHVPGSAIPARRTVEIRGRTVPAPAVPRIEIDRRRPPRRPVERVGPRPDRMAMWALMMGLLLILTAVLTADAGTLIGH